LLEVRDNLRPRRSVRRTISVTAATKVEGHWRRGARRRLGGKQAVSGSRVVEVPDRIRASMLPHPLDHHLAHASGWPHVVVATRDEEQRTCCPLDRNGGPLDSGCVLYPSLVDWPSNEPAR
jgi:hypothetical protein